MEQAKKGKRTHSDRRHAVYVSGCVVLSIVCLLIVQNALQNIEKSQHMERMRSTNVATAKIGSHTAAIFAEKQEILQHYIFRMTTQTPNASVDAACNMLETIYQESSLEFGFLDDRGEYYTREGATGEYLDLKKTISNGVGIAPIKPQPGMDEEKCVILIKALDEPKPLDNGNSIAYMVLKQSMQSIEQSYDISRYGYLFFLIRANGSIIYDSIPNDPMAEASNIWAYMERHIDFQYGATCEAIVQELQSGISNTILGKYNGTNYYISYFSLTSPDWDVLLFIPESNMEINLEGFFSRIVYYVGQIFFAPMVIFLLIAIILWWHSIEEQKKLTAAVQNANDAKTKFLSSMSHDIRTPMNAIIGMTEIAMQQEDTPDKIMESLEKIQLSSSHLLALVNNILDISKIESGKMVLNPAPVSLSRGIGILTNIIRPSLVAKHQTFRIHAQNILCDSLLADELRLNQVTINLLSNAMKYTPDGGRVELNIWQEEIPDKPNMISLSLQIRDNGIGMSPEYQKTMYDSFSRERDSRVSKIAGSGLGLAICKQIVNLMNGTITCDSFVGLGTTFTVTLPMTRITDTQLLPLPVQRILVVDDDPLVLENAKEVFAGLGISAELRTTALLHSETLGDYTAAFVGLGWPANAGLDCVKYLHEKLGADFPVVLASVLSIPKNSDKLEDLGRIYFMAKPYFPSVVHATIRRILNIQSQNCEETQSPADTLTGMRVLVAEDNDMNWEILSTILNMHGVSAVRAENGQECVNRMIHAQADEFDVILMDNRMPIMDGREATRVLRQSDKKHVRLIPIVAMTADAFTEDIQECLDAGMDYHLSKPINTSKLLSLLQQIRSKSDGFTANQA